MHLPISIAIFLLSSLAVAQTAPPAATQPQTAPDPLATNQSQPQAIDFNSLGDKQRGQIDSLLQSPDWPIRVFALLRLERYTGSAVAGRVQRLLKDQSWQVRCFAIRQSKRMRIEIAPQTFAEESDARVIRTALRHGVALDEESVTKVATMLLRTKGIDELMLGLEIATASEIAKVRLDATKRAERLIRNMDNATAALISRRLSVIVNAFPAPQTSPAWQNWLREQGKNFALEPASTQQRRSLNAKPPMIAELEDETFTRLLDYLGFLRQRNLDLVICMDSTASMIPMISQVRAGVDSLILFLNDISREMRLAFVAYRDHDNPPTWDWHPFTKDIQSIRKYLFDLRITGGADYPEAVLDGLIACTDLKWNKQAERQIILVGDAPPHEKDEYRVRALLESMRDDGIMVQAVHVPMEYPEGRVTRMPASQAEGADEWLKTYNTTTGAMFAEIADVGGGRKTELKDAEKLVPSIMHFTIEEAWWPVFDEFYEMYIDLCR
jgi:hypothetical protein